MSPRVPVVTIALPVRNGVNFIGAAIDSVLSQTFGDWELLIADNASVDNTQEICCAYASLDDKIRYVRHSYDLGAAVNSNYLFRAGRGRYFKWLSHDDLISPTWLERCIRTLDSYPEHVVGAHTAVEVIDSAGHLLRTPPPELLPRMHSLSQAERFAEAILVPHNCYSFFGLFRREALLRARPVPSFDGGDRALIAELALVGRFAYLDDVTWQNRDHAARYVRAVRPHTATVEKWWDTDARVPVAHHWRLLEHYWQSVQMHAEPRQRAKCLLALARWPWRNWNAMRLAVDGIGVKLPIVYDLVSRLRELTRKRVWERR